MSTPIEPTGSWPSIAIGAITQPQVLSRVAEERAGAARARAARLHGLAVGHVLEVDLLRIEQGAVRPAARERVLQLVVADDPPGHRVDEQHAARLEAVVDDHVARVQVEHPGLGGEHQQAVPRQRVARRAQAVAIERRADLAAVGEGDRGRAVPRLEQRGVELVEARMSSGISAWFGQAAGISIVSACAGGRPAITSSSSAASSAAESDQRSSMIGNSFARSSPSSAERRLGSRACIHERLPRTVLISPLCAR